MIPYLTIVLTGRNDNFGGNFNQRLFNALSYNHQLLTEARVDYDVVFVEWSPVPNRLLLSDLLRCHVPEVAERLTTYEVDRRYHDAFSQNPRIRFHEFIAKNVGIRRAAGSYILTTNTDIFLSRETVNLIARQMLRPMILYRATRVDMKSSLDLTNLDEDVVTDARNHLLVNAIGPPFFTNASGDFLLLDRFSFHAIRGFNEVFRVAKLLIDANFCYRAAAEGVLLVDSGTRVYHVGEGTLHRHSSTYRPRPSDAPWGHNWRKHVLYENSPDWGLGRAPVVQRSDGHVRLEFAADAVPPLVALQRIRKPMMVS
jgi:hypothetical protein